MPEELSATGAKNPGTSIVDHCLDALVTVQITLVWSDFVLGVVVLRGRKSFSLGERGADFPVPGSLLGTARYQLISFDGSCPRVRLPQDAKFLHLKEGESVQVKLGELSIGVARLASGQRIPWSFSKVDFRGIAVMLAAVALQLSVVAWAAFAIPPSEAALSVALGEPVFFAVTGANLEGVGIPEEDAVPSRFRDLPGKKVSRAGLMSVRRAVLPTKIGEPEALRLSQRRVALQGPEDNPDPHLARVSPPREACMWDGMGPDAESWGGDPLGPFVPWGRDDSLGTDVASARASSLSGEIGPSGGDSPAPPAIAPGRMKKVVKFVGVSPVGSI